MCLCTQASIDSLIIVTFFTPCITITWSISALMIFYPLYQVGVGTDFSNGNEHVMLGRRTNTLLSLTLGNKSYFKGQCKVFTSNIFWSFPAFIPDWHFDIHALCSAYLPNIELHTSQANLSHTWRPSIHRSYHLGNYYFAFIYSDVELLFHKTTCTNQQSKIHPSGSFNKRILLMDLRQCNVRLQCSLYYSAIVQTYPMSKIYRF